MAQPLCPYFNNCGGCSLQHLDYALQLENKKNELKRALQFDTIDVFSGKEYFYRNRMDFIFHPHGLGLRKKGQWHTIIDIDRCVISNETLNNILAEIGAFFRDVDHFDMKKFNGTFHYAVIRTPSSNSSISFVLNEDSKRLADAIEKIEKFSLTTSADNVIVTYNPSNTDMSVSEEYFVVKGSDMLQETYLGKNFMYPVQGFFQNNSEVAEKMHLYCNELLKKHDTKNSHLLDLYGGVGIFGIINADLFKTVFIVENSKQSIEAAQKNIESNNVKNATTIVLDATKLKKLTLPQPLFVITDPPRSGMNPKTIEQLNMLKPKAIIYVSCNVEQLRKDTSKFKDYEIKSAALFDMFPQTNHIEAIVELVLKIKKT